MSTIAVGKGFLKKPFLQALSAAKFGDTLLLDPGEYQLPEELSIGHLKITGNTSDRSQVILKTSFAVNDHLTLENLTLMATPYKCAIASAHHAATFALTNVDIHPDPAGKKVGIYLENGSITATKSLLRAARLENNDYGWSLKASQRSQVHLIGTVCDTLLLQKSTGYINHSTISLTRLEDQSRLQGGPLAATSFEGKRAMVIFEESVVDLSHVDLIDPLTEILVSNSYVHIGSIGAVDGETPVQMKAVLKDGGKAQSSDPQFSAAADGPRPPRDILWKNTPGGTGADSWESIQQQLKPGDTLVLDEGLYVIPGRTTASWNIRGCGRRSVLAADLVYEEEGEYTISDVWMTTRSYLPLNPQHLTYRAVAFPGEKPLPEGNVEQAATGEEGRGRLELEEAFQALFPDSEGSSTPDGPIARGGIDEHNIVRALNTAKVTLSSVTIDRSNTGDCWALWMTEGGHITLENSQILSSTPVEKYGIGVGENGVLRSSSSAVGTLSVLSGGRVDLHGGELTYTAVSGGQLNSTGVLTHGSEGEGYYAFIVNEGGRIAVEDVRSRAEHFLAKTAGSHLTLSHIEAQEATIEWDSQSEGFIDDWVTVVDEDGHYLQGGPTTTQNNTEGTADTDPNSTPLEEEATPHREKIGDSTGNDESLEWGENPADHTEESTGALAELDQLIGLAKVKKQIRTFMGVVEYNKAMAERGRSGVDMSLHSMFLGNPGTGKTTVARLLAQALYEGGVIQRNYLKEVSQEDLVSSHISETPLKTRQVCEEALGGVLFVDEAYALYSEGSHSFGQEAVDTILKFMEDHRDEIVVIFAGYSDKMQDFLGMNPGMRSRVPNSFDFEDYSPDEIADIGCSMLAKTHQFNRELYSDIIRRKYARTSDRSNGRWIRNQNQELLKIVISHFAENPDIAPDVITDSYLHEFGGGDQEESADRVQDLLGQLEELVGLESVKTYVTSLIKQVRAEQKLAQAGHVISSSSTHHMLFLGNPGTGKTTVAQIVAKLFFALGILEKPTVKTVTRRDMVGSYIGHTEAQTGRILDEAMGGVLFVDEAYQLSVEGFERDFGQQAIETLLTALENHRSSFVAIFAGYTDEMEKFLDVNPGLRSRIPHRIIFPDYTPDEIATITIAMLRKTWTLNEDLLRQIIIARYEKETPENRSNARWARNLSDAIQAAHKGWIVDHMESIDPAELKHIHDEVLQQFA